ncbi:MAG: hypothetical protein EAZ09_17725 [Oscillatoriales cyanobacterium]|nr:MAG: hypothetical protein EAZ18_19385 [Oscillatoriales cyanobacterium]TAH18714.1 MAG: hypothetical protein EAZ09_17725 [Oscillatoriales cyanobacterium]
MPKNKLALPLKGCRAQGQLNASFIVGKIRINPILLCDDFIIVHSPRKSLVSKNVTQQRSHLSCPILKAIPHAILTSSSLKLLFYWEYEGSSATDFVTDVTDVTDGIRKKEKFPMPYSLCPMPHSQFPIPN